jgi:hypothetical protein
MIIILILLFRTHSTHSYGAPGVEVSPVFDPVFEPVFDPVFDPELLALDLSPSDDPVLEPDLLAICSLADV